MLYFIKNVLAENTTVRIAFGFSVFLLAQVWIYPTAFQVPFLINGRLFVTNEPSTIKGVLQEAGYKTGSGDLLDIDGEVLKRGGGTASTIESNNNVIIFKPGQNKIEPVQTQTETVVLAAKESGSGEYVIVKSVGKPGEKLVSRGALSGKIISALSLSVAEPMVISRSDVRPEKIVALTFDDGPNPPFTGQIVKILKDAQATATFFMLGRQVPGHEKAVKEVWKAGFQIGNHSFSHGRLDLALEDDLTRELDDTRNLIFSITNTETKWLRPPYGYESPILRSIAEPKGYRVVRWNIDSRDWEATNPDDIVNNTLNAVYPGAIVLMHDGGGNRTNTAMALPRIIQGLRERGYTFVTLDQLVK